MSEASPAPPHVLVPWHDLDLSAGQPVEVYDGSANPADLTVVEYYVVPYACPPRCLEIIPEMPALRAVQVLNAGYDDVLPFLRDGIALHNGRGLHDASTAEHAVALMLAAQRELPRWLADQREQRWEETHTGSLAGSRVLIVGYGSIGAAIEARLRPFDVEIERVARRARPDDGVHAIEDLDALLPWADVVCLVTPLTAATRGLLDARRLGLMTDGALLVNVGRGPVVDTDALLANTGRIRAALDVTDPEPLPTGHPLWSATNVLITPHVAGGSAVFYPQAKRFVEDQVARFLAGEPLRNKVDTPA